MVCDSQTLLPKDSSRLQRRLALSDIEARARAVKKTATQSSVKPEQATFPAHPTAEAGAQGNKGGPGGPKPSKLPLELELKQRLLKPGGRRGVGTLGSLFLAQPSLG